MFMNNFISTRKWVLMGLTFSLALSACSKKGTDDPKPNPNDYTIPTTYNFENVDISGMKDRRKMLDKMIDYAQTARTTGTALDAQKLKNMYSNKESPFDDIELNTSDKKIKSKMFDDDKNLVEDYIDKLVAASKSATAGSQGVAGVVTSKDGTKLYLLDANGMDYTELIEKTVMGACFYYQATAVNLSEELIGDAVDNTTVKPGNGTPMEHSWDEVFGYFGIPKTFSPTTKDSDTDFWGEYALKVDPKLGSVTKIMNALLKGRAAISNNDMAGKKEAIPVVRDEWEKVSAASAIMNINKAKASMDDQAVKSKALSEAIGFIRALKYNPTKKITQAQIDEALGYIGTNLYTVTAANLDQAKNLISSVYNFNEVKDTL
jgi:hypothetical protein